MDKFIVGYSVGKGNDSYINVHSIVSVISDDGDSRVTDTNGKEYYVDCPASILVKQINEMTSREGK